MTFSLSYEDDREDPGTGVATVTYNSGGDPSIGAADSTRVVVVAVGGRTPSAAGISSMTIGGISATQIPGAFVAENAVIMADAWYAAVPTGTTATVTIVWAAALTVGATTAISTWRVIGSTGTPSSAVNASAAANGSGPQPLTLPALTVPGGGAALSVYFNRAWLSPTMSWSSATQDFLFDADPTNGSRLYSGAHTTTAGSVTITATDSDPTNTSTNESVMLAVAWTPAVAPLTGTFYVDNSIGLDTYDGTAQTHTGGTTGPWQTIAHVNAQTFNGGSSVLFNAAQTFVGNIVMGTGNVGISPAPSSSNPLTFGSYGTGKATISSGASPGFAMLDIGGYIIKNLTLTGDGISATVNYGIQIYNTLGTTAVLDFVQVNNCVITAYGGVGIQVWATSTTGGGFSNVTISGCTVHDCGGFTGDAFTVGIETTGHSSGVVLPNFTNVLITNCLVYNIIGAAGSTSDSGFGIYMAETGNSTIQFCEIHDCGSSNGSTVHAGPAGIQFNDCLNPIIQFCEVYNMSAGLSGQVNDGDGFNPSSSVNGLIQYCYSHDNAGSGYLVDTAIATAADCTMRYCISQNDGNQSGNIKASGCDLESDTGNPLVARIFNNTFYSNNGSPPVIIRTNPAEISGHICNNIFYTTTGQSISSAANPPIVFDGNDYFRTSGTSLVWNGTTYTSITSWHAAFTNQETVNGGFTSNPSLVNPGGGVTTHGYNPSLLGAYRLQSASPMLGVGLDMNAHFSINPGTKDYYGSRIPHGAGSGFPVGAAGAITTPSLPLLGVGMIGWRATLPLAAAWKLGKAIAKNGVITRRRLLLPK